MTQIGAKGLALGRTAHRVGFRPKIIILKHRATHTNTRQCSLT